MDNRYYRHNRRKYSLKVHIVLVTKYRKQLLQGSSHRLKKATEKVLFAYKLTQNKVHQSTLRHCI